MRALLVLVTLTAALAVALLIYALTDWAAAAWAALVSAVAIPIARLLLPFGWFDGDVDADIDV
jgi:hypothetical protein